MNVLKGLRQYWTHRVSNTAIRSKTFSHCWLRHWSIQQCNDGVDWIESHAVVEGIHPWTAARWSEEPGTISTCTIFSTISTIVSRVRNQVPPQDRCVFVGSSETCKSFHMKSHHLCLSSEVSFDSFGLPHIFDETISKKNYPGQKSDFKKNKRERSCHCFRQTSPPLGRTRLGDVIFHL